MSRRRLLLASLLAMLVPLSACATNQSGLKADAADPDVVWDGARYVVHTTNTAYGNLPGWTSTDLGAWMFTGDALPTLPSWAAPGWTWAPTSIRRADGTWVLFFSAAVRGRTAAGGQPLKCIGVATARTAVGPFTTPAGNDAQPLVCNPQNGGDIDPSVYRHADGSYYLATKADGNSMARPTWIEQRRLAPSLTSFAAPATVLLNSTTGTWEKQVIEGPDVVAAGGRLHLLYSGGDFATNGYGEGQAACPTIAGPCVRNGRLIEDAFFGRGAGGASAFGSRTGAPLLAWHAYTETGSSRRTLLLGTLGVDAKGVLMVTGSPVPATATGSKPAQRAAGAPTAVQLEVPAGQPITVPNAHTRG